MDCRTDLPGVVVANSCVRSGVRDKSLQDKQREIQDAIDFLLEVEREVKGQQKWLGAVNAAGILACATVITTDIIRDAVKITPETPAQALVMKVLDMADSKAKKSFYGGSRYKGELDKIDKVTTLLKKAVGKADKFGVIDLFADMAKNNLVLAGFAQDGQEAQATAQQSLTGLSKSLEKLRRVLGDIQAKIRDDDLTDDSDATRPVQRMSQAATPLRMP